MITSSIKNFKLGDKVILNERSLFNTDGKLANKVMEITGFNASTDGKELYYQLDKGTDLWYDAELILVK